MTTNNRIVSIEDGEITFTYRDRADENKQKELAVSAEEFIRRFLLHILPRGFMKIRYFGFLSRKNKKVYIPLIRQLIDPNIEIVEKLTETITETMLRLTGVDIFLCPECHKRKMVCAGPLPNPRLIDSS